MPRKTLHLGSVVRFWVRELVLVGAWDSVSQQVLAKGEGPGLQMGWTTVGGRMMPHLENRRVPLLHRAHHQTTNRPPNGCLHLQPGELLWDHVDCKLRCPNAYTPTSWYTCLTGGVISGCGLGNFALPSMIDRSRRAKRALDLAKLERYVGIIGAQWADCKCGQLCAVSNEATRYLARVEVPLLAQECTRDVMIRQRVYNVPEPDRPTLLRKILARHTEAKAPKQGRDDPALRGTHGLVHASR